MSHLNSQNPTFSVISFILVICRLFSAGETHRLIETEKVHLKLYFSFLTFFRIERTWTLKSGHYYDYHQRRGVVKTENRRPIKIQLYDMDFVVLVEKYKFSLKLEDFNDSKL
jgi:hypothetical protein